MRRCRYSGEINTHGIDQDDPREADLVSEAVVEHACPLQHVCAQRARWHVNAQRIF